MSTLLTRIYVEPDVNREIDRVHLLVMAHCGYKIQKAHFIASAIEVGLTNLDALYKKYPKATSQLAS